jgi:hypothetical protein
MGMFDTVYAALDCPFCGRTYRHTPLSHEQAAEEIKKYKKTPDRKPAKVSPRRRKTPLFTGFPGKVSWLQGRGYMD